MAKSDLFKDQPARTPEPEQNGIQAMMPGLSLSKILHDVGKELKEHAVMGSHELASALFRGDSFVLYPRNNHDGVDHGLPNPQQEQERSGREM